MNIDLETLKAIYNNDINTLTHNMSLDSVNVIKGKMAEIPSTFFEKQISIENKQISLIEFGIQTANISADKRKGLMDKYHINPYDMNKLQGIIESIKIAKEYGKINEAKNESEDRVYGIALSNEKNLDKAYPLWVAYLFADSVNPIADIRNKLKEDGMEEKYEPEYIVSLIDYTNELMKGKSESEKKDFYMHSITGILDNDRDILISRKNSEVEI